MEQKECKDDDSDRGEAKFHRSSKEVPASGVASDEDSDAEVEREFRAALKITNRGSVCVSTDPRSKKIVEGFRINWMDMRDASNGKLLWESGEWGERMFREELRADVPANILKCAAVSREINFTSREEIKRFRLEQRIFLHGSCLEEWFFDFGYVIPGSANSWQQTIEAAGAEKMMDARELSGNTTIETSFYDGGSLISKTLVRIHYV